MRQILPVLIRPVDLASPAEMTSEHQAVVLVRDPDGWMRFQEGLKRAGLDAESVPFP